MQVPFRGYPQYNILSLKLGFYSYRYVISIFHVNIRLTYKNTPELLLEIAECLSLIFKIFPY